MIDLMDLMNYNLSRDDTGKSHLANIQLACLKRLTGKNLTPEQLKQIEAALVTDPNMLDHPEMYSDLPRVKAEFQAMKETYLAKNEVQGYTR